MFVGDERAYVRQHIMKKFVLFIFSISVIFITSCHNDKTSLANDAKDTIVIHDTMMLNGVFTYDLPCKIEYIHPEQKGKAVMVFWLHGGVMDRTGHSLLNEWNNHIDKWRNTAYNNISAYLNTKGLKAIYIAPICHKAVNPNCVRWIDCAGEIKHIIDDYVNKGFVDPNRIYVAGTSDGGVGAWDMVEKHGDWFAAAIAMSCGRPRKTRVPVLFSSTSTEGDISSDVNSLVSQGCNIKYEYYPMEKHGGDEKLTCDFDHLEKLFSHVRKR